MYLCHLCSVTGQPRDVKKPYFWVLNWSLLQQRAIYIRRIAAASELCYWRAVKLWNKNWLKTTFWRNASNRIFAKFQREWIKLFVTQHHFLMASWHLSNTIVFYKMKLSLLCLGTLFTGILSKQTKDGKPVPETRYAKTCYLFRVKLFLFMMMYIEVSVI